VAVAAAQAADLIVSVDDGTRRQPLARQAGGQWTPLVEAIQCDRPEAVRAIVAEGATVETPRRVTAAAPEWTLVERAIARVFEQRERDHRLEPRHLASSPMVVDWVYATADADSQSPSFYYFEASKRIPDPGTAPDDDPKGTLRVAVSGWLRAGATEGVTAQGSKSELGWEQDQAPEERAAADQRRADLLPLGVLAIGAQRVWVMHGQAGRIAWFTLYDVGSSGVRKILDVDQERC
jgi:hypothetical protein